MVLLFNYNIFHVTIHLFFFSLLVFFFSFFLFFFFSIYTMSDFIICSFAYLFVSFAEFKGLTQVPCERILSKLLDNITFTFFSFFQCYFTFAVLYYTFLVFNSFFTFLVRCTCSTTIAS